MTQEKHDPKKEKTEPAKEKTSIASSFKRFLKSALITILAILCIIGGVFIHTLYKKPITRKAPLPAAVTQERPRAGVITEQKTHTTPFKTKETPTAEVIPPAEEKLEAAIIYPAPQTSIIPIDDPEELIVVQEKPAPKIKQMTETIPLSTPMEYARPLPREISGIAMADILALQNALNNETSCAAAFQKLSAVSAKKELIQQAVIDLTPYCSGGNTYPLKDLKNTFKKDRKNVLGAYYRENNPLWLAYLKIFAHTMVDVQKLHPSGNSVPDILDKAQNALNGNNITDALLALKGLPGSLEPRMSEFLLKAQKYLKAKESVQMLILSFEQ
ncbi:MAG: hypothetical protein LBU87_00700 [Lactobacillales bacterium]|jgi:hypothetical protein|nr:hypothetical protein [Lactobacillales bacterium]